MHVPTLTQRQDRSPSRCHNQQRLPVYIERSWCSGGVPVTLRTAASSVPWMLKKRKKDKSILNCRLSCVQSAAGFSLSYFEFEHPTNRRWFKGGGVELSTVLNQGTEEEEEVEEGCSFTQGLLSVINQPAGPERERGWGVRGGLLKWTHRSAMHTTQRWTQRQNAQRTNVTYAIINRAWITAQSGYITNEMMHSRAAHSTWQHVFFYFLNLRLVDEAHLSQLTPTRTYLRTLRFITKRIYGRAGLQRGAWYSKSTVAPYGHLITEQHSKLLVNPGSTGKKKKKKDIDCKAMWESLIVYCWG